MRRRVTVLTLVVCAAGCTTSAPPNNIVITGASTIAPLMAEIGKRFEARRPDVRVDVQTGGSSRGIADATRGLADIGMSSRALTETESRGLVTDVLALDGVCFLVHKDNPVGALDDEQIVGIFTGRIRNWKDVGGRDATIVAINRADGRSEIELFSHHFKVKITDLKGDLIAGDNEQGIKMIVGNPDGIIFMSLGTSQQAAARGEPIKLLPLGGVEATVDNVRAGAYPFARPLLLIRQQDARPLVRELIEFALTPEMRPLVERFSFVPAKE